MNIFVGKANVIKKKSLILHVDSNFVHMQKTIDLDAILKSKMGNKARYVPGFLVSWLKKTVHQDRVNKFLWESRHLTGTEWLEECVRYLDMTLVVEGRENLPDPNDGKRYTFVSNHPLGGADGVALGAIIGRHYDSKFRYLVNDLLMNLPGLAPLCIGINKTGKQGRSFPAMVEAGFQSDNHMLMFPAGSVRVRSMVRFTTYLGKRPSSQRVWSTIAMSSPSISAAGTPISSIIWQTCASDCTSSSI